MIGFAGGTHMAAIMQAAAHIKGMETTAKNFEECDLVFIAQDVNKDEDLPELRNLIANITGRVKQDCCLVLCSQVPLGFTKQNFEREIYYQVDTIVMNKALERALDPEQFIVGANNDEPFPTSYAAYLSFFKVPIVRMSLEAAELTKHAINYYLAAQVACSNVLSKLAPENEWPKIVEALRNDKRIGPYAYLNPGVIGGHLPRDVCRIGQKSADPLTRAIEVQCQS
jgi:UDPglucose 6-dehydrogenase